MGCLNVESEVKITGLMAQVESAEVPILGTGGSQTIIESFMSVSLQPFACSAIRMGLKHRECHTSKMVYSGW